jgi:phosphatidylinositol glycan class W
MSNSGYKEAKELFVSNTKGSTISHINLIILISFTSLCFYTALRTHLRSFPPTRSFSLFGVQFVLLVLPILGSVTYAARGTTGFEALKWNIVFGMLVLAVCLRFDPKRRIVAESIPTSSPNPAKIEFPSEQTTKKQQNERQRQNTVLQLSAVTTWRAHMMLLTVLCILAVDFPIFPRTLAKCETFGVSVVRLNCYLVPRSC